MSNVQLLENDEQALKPLGALMFIEFSLGRLISAHRAAQLTHVRDDLECSTQTTTSRYRRRMQIGARWAGPRQPRDNLTFDH
eukprot:CAMPEP_0119421908 /NCGR_PEP_ID=MMETSP1335-20130426/26979_1 /TAXON_ID=259385 /ORGANISM="Chrysoculter rhomboideus, Strain RCC1486" /LENGTH=81 /DNA_ID=CAMNT_0007447333 /DNA_START=159 /DNA_END=401 /DNA_ORIENTATION=-